MAIYLFFREEGFYPVDANNDAHTAEMAMVNYGTVKVEHRDTGKIIFPLSGHSN